MEVQTAFDLAAMVGYMCKTTDHELDIYTASGTLIFDQRNKLVHTAIDAKCDYIVFIDADMRFPKDTITRLLAHDKDIIGVNATTRSEPVLPTAKNLRIEEDGSCSWLPIYSNVMTGISQADGIGCGVMMIKTKVFAKLEEPYFYFEQLPDNKILGEDIYFCIKAKDVGITTWVDHELSMGIRHIGQYTYSWDNIEKKI
jgi:cellulose synthase/poly-beta-1,6-N-acetylglucosamine synthase-like glycosyltransferase